MTEEELTVYADDAWTEDADVELSFGTACSVLLIFGTDVSLSFSADTF